MALDLLIREEWMSRSGKESCAWKHLSSFLIRIRWGWFAWKQLWPQRLSLGSTSEGLWLPDWGQDWRPSDWEESVSPLPLGEEVEDRKRRADSQAASQKAWASCLSQPGTSGHVSTSCPSEKQTRHCAERSACLWNMAVVHQQVAHFSTVYNSAWTSFKHIP